MIHDLTFAEAIAKAEHLVALGSTTVYLRSAEGFPYDEVSEVVSGSSYRLGGPSSCYLIVLKRGLTFKLSVEFEGRDANGKGVSMFDRDRLRDLLTKLSPKGTAALAQMLETECLPGLAKSSAELRAALRSQADSEDCVRGLIAAAKVQS